MARRFHTAVAWLLALAMPFQLLSAVYLHVLGPAHFHIAHDDDHDHDHVAHHHHHRADTTVVALDHEAMPLKEEGAAGWSGTLLAGLATEPALPYAVPARDAVTPRQQALLQSRFPAPPEHPPRIGTA